jgi:hypothetical protein
MQSANDHKRPKNVEEDSTLSAAPVDEGSIRAKILDKGEVKAEDDKKGLKETIKALKRTS